MADAVVGGITLTGAGFLTGMGSNKAEYAVVGNEMKNIRSANARGSFARRVALVAGFIRSEDREVLLSSLMKDVPAIFKDTKIKQIVTEVWASEWELG